jgi:SAM-dependent methyltransferase
MKSQDIARAYDKSYTTPNYFGDKRWLFRPFVKALIAEAGLSPGASVLDAACGQGFFAGLLAEQGMDVLGVDLSAVGIESAKRTYGQSGARFEVGDILQLPYDRKFDCVFIRSCSLYNTVEFAKDTAVTDRLLRYVKEGGVLIFDYYTRLSTGRHSSAWRYHSLAEVREHFSRYRGAQVCFSVRLESRLLGRLSFLSTMSTLSALASRTTGIGGELVAFVRPGPAPSSTYACVTQE